MIFIASDHGGFELKNYLIEAFHKKGIFIHDVGPKIYEQEDDYPDYVYPLTQKVLEDLPNNKGIVICKNGVGVTIFANKVRGIRAGLSWEPKHAESMRNDDDTNVLALPADYITKTTAIKVVTKWLEKKFSEEARHLRRVKKIISFERKNTQY